jgi:two-component system, chemotaxis family, protein-glutamate methylesterase/glutaminase
MSVKPDIVAIGASAGGIDALRDLLQEIPAGFSGAILVVVHRPPEFDSRLHEVLGHYSHLPVVLARAGETMKRGVCYVSTPSQHLTLDRNDRFVLLPDGFYRAHNIDVLFHSLARNAGPRTIGVILSGMQKDGTAGLAAIKEAGGVALVQAPREAAYPDMPRNAILHDGGIDLVAPARLLGRELCRRVGVDIGEKDRVVATV